MFPNLLEALEVKKDPKTATNWIIKMLEISPSVFLSESPQLISCSPK